MAKAKGLGKGLDSLIPMGVKLEEKKVEVVEAPKPDLFVNVSKIEANRSQPRKKFEKAALQELADSIKTYGVIQPLIVRKKGNFYEVVAGERRWRAAKIAGLKEVPVVVKEYSDREVAEIALIENLQRENLNPIEEAMGYESLIQEYGLKQEEVASRVSKSRTVITNSLRLLKLDSKVQNHLMSGKISVGHGKVLLALEDPQMQQEATEQIILENLSVRQTEKLVKNMLTPKVVKEKPELPGRAIYEDLENRLTERMGTKVKIQRKNEKKGKIEIEYYSVEELERVISLMGLE